MQRTRSNAKCILTAPVMYDLFFNPADTTFNPVYPTFNPVYPTFNPVYPTGECSNSDFDTSEACI